MKIERRLQLIRMLPVELTKAEKRILGMMSLAVPERQPQRRPTLHTRSTSMSMQHRLLMDWKMSPLEPFSRMIP